MAKEMILTSYAHKIGHFDKKSLDLGAYQIITGKETINQKEKTAKDDHGRLNNIIRYYNCYIIITS